jgi:hypothetical protein
MQQADRESAVRAFVQVFTEFRVRHRTLIRRYGEAMTAATRGRAEYRPLRNHFFEFFDVLFEESAEAETGPSTLWQLVQQTVLSR